MNGYPLKVRQTIIQESLTSANLALLRTGRQVYLEAVSIPYSSSTFDIDDLETLVDFSVSVRPQRLATIRRLSVYLEWRNFAWFAEEGSGDFSHTSRVWEEFWNVVCDKMTSPETLNFLIVTTSSHFLSSILEHEGNSSTRPMMRKRGLKHCDLVVEPLSHRDTGQVPGPDGMSLEPTLDAIKKRMCEPTGAPTLISSEDGQDPRKPIGAEHS